MYGGLAQSRQGSFTSLGSPAVVNVCLGEIPSVVVIYSDVSATTPDFRTWFNANTTPVAQVVQVNPGAVDTSILTTGSTGATSKETASINQYLGGDTPVSADVTNKKYVDDTGTAIAVGVITSAGFIVPAGSQVASGKSVWVAYFPAR